MQPGTIAWFYETYTRSPNDEHRGPQLSKRTTHKYWYWDTFEKAGLATVTNGQVNKVWIHRKKIELLSSDPKQVGTIY